MGAFSTYLTLGMDHIKDINAYDHIVFIIALCAIYQVKEWKKVLILVTAFTIGHSLTLALAALDMVKIKSEVIEFLIPLTIFITSIYNMVVKRENESVASKKLMWNYGFALFFGLIHGMGFSNYFRSLLGKEESITLPLFAFNVGIELGQLIIVAIIFVFSFLFLNLLKVKQREWSLIISGAAAGIAMVLMLETKFW